MDEWDEGSRIVAACDACGAVYAAIELANKGIVPIGSRDGCASCGGTEFTPLPGMMESSESTEEGADD